jgi:hypothetical protein
MAGITRQLDLQPATALAPTAGTASDSSAEIGITQAILDAEERRQRALKIDLATTWWSTRLYLIAALAQRLTPARRILIIHAQQGGAVASPGPSPTAVKERFVGQLSTAAIISTIAAKVPAIGVFEQSLQSRPPEFNDLSTEISALLDCWRTAFGDSPGNSANEAASKVDLTPELLRRWFGDAMLKEAVRIVDLQRASVVDLLRLLDYPNDFVPVLTRHVPAAEGSQPVERVDVMDKNSLNARLARSYLVELMDRARIG